MLHLVFEETRACRTFTPGRGWSLLKYPDGLGLVTRELLDTLWMCLLLVPVGFWAVDARRLVAAGVVSALGIVLAVAIRRLAAPDWNEIVGALAGLLVGWGLRFLVTLAAARFRDA